MTAEQEKTLEALKIAIGMEIDGKKYYQKLSRTFKDKLGIKLFSSLAEAEDVHRTVFEGIYKDLQIKKAWPEVKFTPHSLKELQSLFALASEEAASGSSELEAIQIAMDMENKTLDFYNKQSKKAAFEAEKKFYIKVAGEESAHHAVLLDYFEYLKDPVGWFTMKEHHSLDGG